jgi:hypothetical protein
VITWIETEGVEPGEAVEAICDERIDMAALPALGSSPVGRTV